MAVVAFILSLASVPLFLFRGLGWLTNLAAFILGILANSRIKQSQGQLTGKGFAVAGIVLSCVWFGLAVLAVVLFGLGIAWLLRNPAHMGTV